MLKSFIIILIFYILISVNLKKNLPVISNLGVNFSLESTKGEIRTLNDYKGKLLLIFFGFTFCPDVCPSTLSKINNTFKKIIDYEKKIDLVFISLDPERDNLDVLKNYLSFFNENFVGLRGTSEQIGIIARKFGIFFEKNFIDNKYYLIDHSSYIFLLDKNSRVRKIFKSDANTDDLIKNIKYLL